MASYLIPTWRDTWWRKLVLIDFKDFPLQFLHLGGYLLPFTVTLCVTAEPKLRDMLVEDHQWTDVVDCVPALSPLSCADALCWDLVRHQIYFLSKALVADTTVIARYEADVQKQLMASEFDLHLFAPDWVIQAPAPSNPGELFSFRLPWTEKSKKSLDPRRDGSGHYGWSFEKEITNPNQNHSVRFVQLYTERTKNSRMKIVAFASVFSSGKHRLFGSLIVGSLPEIMQTASGRKR